MSERRYEVRYALAYDGGGVEFTRRYRTRVGARMARLWHLYVSSWSPWGGSAVLVDLLTGEDNDADK